MGYTEPCWHSGCLITFRQIEEWCQSLRLGICTLEMRGEALGVCLSWWCQGLSPGVLKEKEQVQAGAAV